jgi:hypothetical protein
MFLPVNARSLSRQFLYPFSDYIVVFSTFWLFGIAFCFNELVPFILLNRYHDSNAFVKQSAPGTVRQLGLDCAILVAQKYTGQFLMGLILGPIIAKF